jgi:DNA-binding MarR family transcriptional regulator
MSTQRPPCLALALRRADRVVSQLYNRHIAPTGLRGTQFTVLSVIAEQDCITARDLSEALCMDPTTASRALKPLIRDGYVEARPAPHDRREKMLCLTRAGRRVHEKAYRGWTKAQEELRQRLGAVDSDALLGLMRRVSQLGDGQAR